MRKVMLLITLACLMLFGFANVAGATDPHWTDGSTYQGSVNYGPPPAIQSEDPCNIWMLDPPGYVFLTIHFFEGSVEYDSVVVPYTGTLGSSFPHNVHDVVDNHEGGAYLTWNIGTGHSPLFQFNCLTQTTTSTVSSTTSSTTTTTMTSSSTVSTSSSSTTSTSTTEPSPSNPQNPPSQSLTSTKKLADTGFGNVALIVVGLGALIAGLAMVFGKRNRKER